MRSPKTCSALLAILALLSPRAASATVNVEKLRGEAEEGFTGTLDGSLALQRGNVDVLELGGALKLELKSLYPAKAEDRSPLLRERWLALGDLRFAEKDRSTYQNAGFGHLRWTRMWIPRFGTELFSQLQFNEFTRLNTRLLAGGGLRVDVNDEKVANVWIGTAYMFELERVDVGSGEPEEESIHHRWSSYLGLRLVVVEDHAFLSNVAYVQPRFDELGDLRVLEELDFEVKIQAAFSVVASLVLEHDSDPPPGVQSTDLRLKNSIRVRF